MIVMIISGAFLFILINFTISFYLIQERQFKRDLKEWHKGDELNDNLYR